MSAIVVPFHSVGREPEPLKTRNYVKTFFDESYGVQWQILLPNAPRRITLELIDEILELQHEFINQVNDNNKVKYQIFSSEMPGIFSLGGDLKFFAKCAFNKDYTALSKYGRDAVDISYNRATNFHKPITTISLVKGAALGGGFEAALASNYLIAEEQSTFSFPETRFGLFPAHGAFTFLRHRLPVRQAEEIIYSGKTYSATELYDLGIVDLLCPTGEGDSATLQFVRQRHLQHEGIHAMREMVQKYALIDREELYAIVDHWVEKVMQLDKKQLRLIEALAKTSEGFINNQQHN